MNRELAKLDIEISKYVKDNEDKIIIPTRAYITFEDEEGYQRACHLDKKSSIFSISSEAQLNGKPLYFKAAPEASNIIWENQYSPTMVKLYKRFIAIIVVMIILVA